MKLRWIKGDWEFGKYKLQMKKDGCADVWEDVPVEIEEKINEKTLKAFLEDEYVEISRSLYVRGASADEILNELANATVKEILRRIDEFANYTPNSGAGIAMKDLKKYLGATL